jgi:hypothetical protein
MPLLSTNRRRYGIGLALVLAACEQPAATRPTPALAPERAVAAAAAALPVSSPADLEAARVALSRAAGPDRGPVAAPERGRGAAVSDAIRAAAALQPLLPAPAAREVATTARSLATQMVGPDGP